MDRPPQTDRRKAPRSPARYKVRFWNEDIEGTGRTTDVSRTGIFIQTRQLATRGARIHLEIEVDGRPFHAEGVVARVQKVSASVAPIVSSGIGVRLHPWAEVVDSGEPDNGESGDQQSQGLTLDLRDPKRLQEILEDEIKGGGVFLATTAAHEVGDPVVLHIALPDPHGVTEITGRVVRRLDNPPGIGIELPDAGTTYTQISSILYAPLVETEAQLQRDTRFQITVSSRGVPTMLCAAVELTVPCAACADLPPGGFRVLEVAAAAPAAAPPEEPEPDLITLDLSDPAALIRAYDEEIRNGALFIATGNPADLNEVVTVYVALPPPHGVLEAQGRVRHKSTDPPGLGLELTDRVVIDAAIGPILAKLGS